MHSVSRSDVEDFLFTEADLLDQWRLPEWLTLFTDDAKYEVPCTDLPPDASPDTNLFYIADDRVRLGERRLEGVASFGVRPTVDNGAACLETYIFDFNQDIYGREIEVEIVARIRPELKFRDLEELKAAMQADMLAARQLLASAD